MSDPVITSVEPSGPKGAEVRVHLDGGDRLELLLETFERSGLGTGDPLSEERRRLLLDADTDHRIHEAALGLLSARARSRADLVRRLRKKGFAARRIDPVLDRLEEKGLLDDEAVAAAFVRDRLRHRPRGRARLQAELRSKGVRADVAEEAIGRIFEDEEVSDTGLALEAAEQWIGRQGAAVLAALVDGSRTPDRERARRRLYGYLARRGFRGDALRDAMDRAVDLARDAR